MKLQRSFFQPARRRGDAKGSTKASSWAGLSTLVAALSALGTVPELAKAADLNVVDGIASASWVKGHILVQPRAGLSDTEFQKALGPHGGKVVGTLGNLNIYIVSLPAQASEQAVATALSKHPHMKFAEVDQIVAPSFTTNDSYLSSEWHLATVNAPAAWDTSIGSGVTVAILDSGIDDTHPDLLGQLVPGWNFFDNNNVISDVYGHGTKVAGVVGAVGGNAMGVAGVAWGSRLMPVRVTDLSGSATWSAIASGLNWAADHGARVANLSFCVQASSSTQTAAQYFQNKGGVVVNSAGNYGTLDSTAASNVLISVSATDSTDTLAGWSSFGPYVDVSAPGVGIWTTTMGGGYGAVSGTSFSSPLTAGTIALMLAANSSLAPSQVVSLLKSTSVDLGATGYDYYYGSGRINAEAAVLGAAATSFSDTQPPSVILTSPTGGSVSGVVPIDVSASDNVGVTRVELLINNTVSATDSTSPHAFSWDASALAGTNATIAARAYDAAGNSSTSAPVTVAVSSSGPAGPDTTPPTVSITNPGNGSTVAGMVTIGVSASDNVGLASVSLYVDGTLLNSGNSGAMSYKWNTNKVAKGSHTLSATAKDQAGNQATTSIQVRR